MSEFTLSTNSGAITSTRTTALPVITTSTPAALSAAELDKREETSEDINIVDIGSANVGHNNRIIGHHNKNRAQFRIHKQGQRGRGGVRRQPPSNRKKENFTEKMPLDISQTASNLFLSTFMGAQRTERPIISSTTSKMVIVAKAEVAEKSTTGMRIDTC